jgi:hypothetical protein
VSNITWEASGQSLFKKVFRNCKYLEKTIDIVKAIGFRAMNNGKSWKCLTTTLIWLSEVYPSLTLQYVKIKLTRKYRRIYYNAERARTCNSVVTQVPGMFASVNNSTDPTTGQIIGYISNAGIPSISNQTVQELDVITPYSVFPTVFIDNAVGMAWWKNMVDGKKMQSMLLQ